MFIKFKKKIELINLNKIISIYEKFYLCSNYYKLANLVNIPMKI